MTDAQTSSAFPRSAISSVLVTVVLAVDDPNAGAVNQLFSRYKERKNSFLFFIVLFLFHVQNFMPFFQDSVWNKEYFEKGDNLARASVTIYEGSFSRYISAKRRVRKLSESDRRLSKHEEKKISNSLQTVCAVVTNFKTNHWQSAWR